MLVRSNSRISGSTSHESETCLPGKRARRTARLPLVRVVAVRVQEAHRDRVDVRGFDLAERRLERRRIERGQHAAALVDPLVDREAQRALDQRFGLLPAHVVRERDADAAQFEHVAETGRRQERGAHPFALEDRVGRDGRRMGDLGDRPRSDGVRGAVRGDRIDDRAGVVARRGRDFQLVEAAVGAQEDEIGERSADVDADAHARRVVRHRAATAGVRSAAVAAASTRHGSRSTATP